MLIWMGRWSEERAALAAQEMAGRREVDAIVRSGAVSEVGVDLVGVSSLATPRFVAIPSQSMKRLPHASASSLLYH